LALFSDRLFSCLRAIGINCEPCNIGCSTRR
jgi:hypothetical protein